MIYIIIYFGVNGYSLYDEIFFSEETAKEEKEIIKEKYCTHSIYIIPLQTIE